MLNEILIALGLMVAPPQMMAPPKMMGDCSKYHVVVECSYKEVSDKELISVIGRHYIAGPWATEEENIRVAFDSLVDNVTAVMNAKIGGAAIFRIGP